MIQTDIRPSEIIFLDFIDGKDENVHISESWKFNYGIDANKTITKLINLQYLVYKNDLVRNISKSTIPELKLVLKNNNLKVTGKKQELVERLLGNIDTDYLDRIFNKKIFIVTSLGKRLIENNYLYIINKKRNYMFTDTEISVAYTHSSLINDNDRIWNIFNNRNITFINEKNWSSYRVNLFNMGEFLFKENKYEQALGYYIAVFIIDLSGMQNNNYLWIPANSCVAPGVISRIKNLRSICEYSSNDIKKLVINDCYTNNLPFKYYDNNSVANILTDCLENIEINFKKYPHNIPNKNSTKYIYYSYTKNNNLDKNSNILLDLFLIILTCGLWVIWMIIRPKKN